MELLSALSLFPMPGSAETRAKQLISRDPDWDLMFQRAHSLEILPVVYANLAEPGLLDIPVGIRNRAARQLQTARARIMARVLTANHVLERFASEGISTLVLKGPATGVSAYGDPSLRNFADLDVLVRREAVGASRDLLLSLGFKPHYEPEAEDRLLLAGHALEFMRPTLKVELHTELMSRYLRVPFVNEEVWGTSRFVRCADASIRVLSPDIEFIFLAAHGAKHEWLGFRWICDVGHLARRLSREERLAVAARSRRLNSLKLVALAVQLVRDAFALECGEELETVRRQFDSIALSRHVLSRFCVDAIGSSAVTRVLGRVHPVIPSLIFWSRTRERWRDRLLPVVSLAAGRFRGA